MGVLADLVPRAQPAVAGGGCPAAASVGASWLWPFADVVDNAGDPIDLSAVTGTCEIQTDAGSLVVAIDFDGDADGTFTLSLDEADTAGLTPTGNSPHRWYLTLDDGDDLVQVWGPENSKFQIRRGE